MIRRSLGAALWTLVGLLAGFLGALSSLVGTGAGRTLLARVSEGALRQVFTGTVEIGHVGGSLLTGVTLHDVRLFDADTTLVAFLPQANVSYNPFDFAAGRIVLFELDLHHPVINLVQHPGGRLNIEELLRLGGANRDTGPHGPAAFILFRNVRITDGSVTLRLQAPRAQPGDSSLEIETGGPNGRMRVRRFEHLNTRVNAFQISSPRERGIRIDVAGLAVESSDPVVRLTDVAGRLKITGDSLDLRLARVRLPGSALRDARGLISWPRDTVLFDLRVRADSATLGDFRFIDRRFGGVPGAGVVSGDVRLRSHGGRVLEVGLDPVRLAYGVGSLAGRLTAFSVADSGLVALRDADLDASDFDLEFARPFLDTLPFAGRLTGHTTATGQLAALALETDWSFRDSLVPGWPESRVRGKGEVSVGGGLRFQSFAVEAAIMDLGTVAQLAPAVRLHGTLAATGELTGPLTDAQFAGTLAHRDGNRPVSTVSGTLRLDTQGDVLGIYADVNADSLSFDGLRGSFPTLPLRGAVSGPIKLAGPLTALEAHVDMRGGGGGVRGDGTLLLDLPHYGARDLRVAARDVDLAHWLEGRGSAVPPSRLTFSLRASLEGDSAVAPVGTLHAVLEPSQLAGSSVDSGAVTIRFADQRLYVDSLRVLQAGLVATGSGSLGWTHGSRGQLALDVDADNLASVDPLVAWLSGSAPIPDASDDPADDTSAPLAGSARVVLRLEGSLDSLSLEARASVERVAWRAWRLPAGRARLAWRPGPAPTFALEATLDSVAHGSFGLSGGFAAARGTPDSLTWQARSRIGDGGAVLAGGRFARHGIGAEGRALSIGLDSLAVRLPGDVWVLERPTELSVTDSAARVSHLALQSAYGPGKLVLEGALPTRGRADAHLQLEAFPVAGLYALLERDTAGVGGTVTVAAGLSGTRASPVSSGSFSLSNATFGEFRAPFVDGTFDYHDQRLRGALHLWRSGQQILDVQVHLPLDLALEPVPRRQLPDTLSVGARADSVDLSVLEALTPALRQVAGVFSADLGIAGTWDAPRLRGGLTLADAAATIPALNVRYEDIDGHLTFSGDTIAVQTLTTRSERGRADITGFVRLEQLTHPVLDLRIAADQFKALDLRNNVTIAASGRLALTGPVFGATLTGHAKVTSGVLYFADLVQKRIVNLDELADTSLAALIAQQRLGPEFENVFLDSLRIDDLELEMGSDVWLRSNEANIQLAGSARLTKRRDQYLVSGTLQALRGTYRLKVGSVLSREFVVTDGTVRYFGTPDQDAALDIKAKHVVHPVPAGGQPIEDITVVAHIGGTLLVPKVTLEAEKYDLSQTEIISLLLFGKRSVDLGSDPGFTDQRALVQSALAILSGEIEQTIVSGGVPVDYVEIRPGGGGPGTAVVPWNFAVGRQLGPKTFLVVNAGFCSGGQVEVQNMLGLSLQFRISPEWRTEASFAPVQTCSIDQTSALGNTVLRQVGLDLFWERRY